MDLSTGVAAHFYYLGTFVAPFILFQMFAGGGLRDAWRDLGYVAETSPKCGTAQRFSLARVGIASSVLFMPMSKGVLRGFSGVCSQCPGKCELQATGYAAIEADAKTPLDKLIAETNRFTTSRSGVTQPEKYMRDQKARSVEENEAIDAVAEALARPGLVTSMGIVDVVKSTFGGAIALWVVTLVEYGFMSGLMGKSDAADGKFLDDWMGTLFLVSACVSFAVVIFGLGIWARAIRLLVARFGTDNFNRTSTLRKAGVMVLGLGVGLAILGFVQVLDRFGF